MCGIFGACLKPKIMSRGMSKAALAKFKLLGLYNVERGKHSCGVLVNEKIYKGIGEEKLFDNFIVKQGFSFPEPEGNFVMIGHTRQATHGNHTKDNAHPFIVDDNFVLAHNGVIQNVWDLCEKYGIEHDDLHVDSLGLAHVINKEGFKVLSEYKGFAALLMTKLNEPNSLYMYRGESKLTYSGNVEDERPLFYLQSEEGIYISSLAKSLSAISDAGTDKIHVVPANTVIKLTNGVVTKAQVVIDRENANVGTEKKTYGGSPEKNYPKHGARGTKPHTDTMNPNSTLIGIALGAGPSCRVGAQHGSSSLSGFQPKITPLIWHETLPIRARKYDKCKGIMYHMGRYWVVDKGEIFLAHGGFYINKRGVIHENKQKDSDNHYIYQGVLCKHKKAYDEACNDALLKDVYCNYAMHISKYSSMAVCNSRHDVSSKCRNVNDYWIARWCQNGAMVTNTGFTPKWSDRNYTIRDGLAATIECQQASTLEETINEQSYEAEKAHKENKPKEKEIFSPSTSPVIIPPFGPNMLRPVIGGNAEAVRSEGDFDIKNFYKTWDSVEQVRLTLDDLQTRALKYYMADIMMTEMQCTPDNINEDEVDTNLNIFLMSVVDSQESLYQAWDKNYKDILDYMLVANENPDGGVWATIFSEEAEVAEEENKKKFELVDGENQSCPFVPKDPRQIFHEHGEVEETTIEDEIASLDENLKLAQRLSARQANALAEMENYEEGFDGEEGGEFDEAAHARFESYNSSSATAQVEMVFDEREDDEPKAEEIRRDTEILYNIQDIVDFACDSRECADKLFEDAEDDFCQEIAYHTYSAVDQLLTNVRDVCIKHNKKAEIAYYYEIMEKKQNTHVL